nr:hypothetical protein Iba_chr03eCG3440 [Ipomoea batatas]
MSSCDEEEDAVVEIGIVVAAVADGERRRAADDGEGTLPEVDRVDLHRIWGRESLPELGEQRPSESVRERVPAVGFRQEGIEIHDPKRTEARTGRRRGGGRRSPFSRCRLRTLCLLAASRRKTEIAEEVALAASRRKTELAEHAERKTGAGF